MALKSKLIITSLTLLGAVVFFISCRKEKKQLSPLTSLTVTNAVVNSPALCVNYSRNSVTSNTASKFVLFSGDNLLYIWPKGDSANPYYVNPKFQANNQGLYSLFIAGQKPNINALLLEDKIPYHTDSTGGVRFINLCPDSPPLYVILSTTPLVKEVSNLGYLGYTDYLLYPARISNTSYTFEFRKVSDNTKIASITLSPVPRFSSVTLFLGGLISNNSAKVTMINNNLL